MDFDFNIDTYTDYLFNKWEKEENYDYYSIQQEIDQKYELLADDARLLQELN